MKKLVIISVAAVSLLSCTHDFSNYGTYVDPSTLQDKDPSEVTQEDIQANVASIFGAIDPNQDWHMINSGEITISADADLDDIVKVQILSESPFLNANAMVLNEAEAKKGDIVTLVYDAPEINTHLFAACVSSTGVYRVQVFEPGASQVDFKATYRSRTRAGVTEVPTNTTIKLKAPTKSINAQRAEKGASCVIDGKSYPVWADSKWSDEVWEPADGQVFDNGWRMDSEANRGHIFREIDGFAEGEKENVQQIINDFIYKYQSGTSGNKKNNISSIRNSTYFHTSLNYVTSDGLSPVTLIPIQGWSTEFKMNHVYYYYYRTEDIPAGMSEVDYIKTLPKFKAIQVERMQTTEEAKAGTMYRRQEFLLPFYKNAPKAGDNEVSFVFPKGYKIGFFNRKYSGLGNPNWAKNDTGCIYGDGRLNYETNHVPHFLYAMDKTLGGNIQNGMTYTDPRIAIFTANDKTYMCFEEGADCTFCDMIIEIGSGVEKIEEHIDIDNNAYTMCFEDSPIADYDMNDVVLKFERLSHTSIKVSLVACGAYDRLFLRGLNGSKLNGDKEIHAMFGATTNETFINTQGEMTYEPIEEIFTINATMRLSDFVETIYVYDETKDRNITLAGVGEDPHAIVIPSTFEYPMERTNISKAYPLFKNWANYAENDKYWFKEIINEEYVNKFD